jgi:membrane associated rhomboid family serine protease
MGAPFNPPLGNSVPTTPESPTARIVESVKKGGLAVGGCTAAMWLSEAVDRVGPVDLDRHGIRPLTLWGLDGIVWAPFLHNGFGHLIANTIPFVVLGLVIALQKASRFVSVFVLTALGSGLGTWLTGGRNTVHLGASGVVFGLLGYLVARGVFDRKAKSILIGVIALVGYGSMLWGVLPNRPGISWQAHLFGLLAGIGAAKLLDGRTSAPAR